MKNLSPLNKVIFLVNNLFALLFLCSYILPFVPPEKLPLLAVFSLTVPLILLTHLAFVLYWILSGLKRQWLLSMLCLLIAIYTGHFPYKFKGKDAMSEDSISIMSFNVRRFNDYQWIKDEEVPEQMRKFLEEMKPGILVLQEYGRRNPVRKNYAYAYEEVGDHFYSGMAILSEFPIVGRGNLRFKKSSNNGIFTDIRLGKDTLRVYNLHLESLGIRPDSMALSELDEERSKKMLNRLSHAFKKQQEQVDWVKKHMATSPHPYLVCGDFNNTSYSWAYKELKGELKDSFLEAGKGFGETYSFNRYPLRIDFILVDPALEVEQHQNFNLNLSDHEPVLARIKR